MASKKTIPNRDANRDIGAELLQAIRDVKAGKYGAKYGGRLNTLVVDSADGP
jgi:putative transcriptional regulator